MSTTASAQELRQRQLEREEFLREPLNFDDMYRQCTTRVQYMKSRQTKIFEPEDDGFDLYPRAKRALSKMEYARRQMDESEAQMALARCTGDEVSYKKYDKEYEKHMKNALYNHFGIGQLYTMFRRAKV